MTIEIPSGFKQVTKEEFFDALYKDTRDIMPRIESPYLQKWETKNRYVWGISSSWKNHGEEFFAIKD